MLRLFFFAIVLFISPLSQASPENPETPEELALALKPHGDAFKIISSTLGNNININRNNKYLLTHGLAVTAPEVGRYQFYGVLSLGPIPPGAHDKRDMPLYIDITSPENPKPVFIVRRGLSPSLVVERVEVFLQQNLKPSQKLVLETAGGNAIRKWKHPVRGIPLEWEGITETTWDAARDAYARKNLHSDYQELFDIARNSPDISLFDYGTRRPFTEAKMLNSNKTALKQSVVAVHIANQELGPIPSNIRDPEVAISRSRHEIYSMVSGGSDGLQMFEIWYADAALTLDGLPDFGGIVSAFCRRLIS